MAVNKVIYGGNTVIDLTGDTVTPETLAEGAIAHDKSGAVIHGTMAVIKRTPYFYDDADGRWVDNSEGMIFPDYDMTCPKCGARLQSYMSIDENPVDTNCPICNLAITLTNGSVIERSGSSDGGPYYFDVVDQMWMNNGGDAPWGTPDYPDMSCPHCGGTLQANYDIDGNPQDTTCPYCHNDIQLLDGSVLSMGEPRKWIFRNEVFTSMQPRYDLPALEANKNYTIVINGEEGSNPWFEGTGVWFYADIWESFMVLEYSSSDPAGTPNCPTWTLLSEDYIGANISVYEYEE